MNAIDAYQQALQDYLAYISTGKWRVARYTIGNREMVYRTPDELFKALKLLKTLADEENPTKPFVGRTRAVSAYRR